jgi:hypothetical protein
VFFADGETLSATMQIGSSPRLGQWKMPWEEGRDRGEHKLSTAWGDERDKATKGSGGSQKGGYRSRLRQNREICERGRRHLSNGQIKEAVQAELDIRDKEPLSRWANRLHSEIRSWFVEALRAETEALRLPEGQEWSDVEDEDPEAEGKASAKPGEATASAGPEAKKDAGARAPSPKTGKAETSARQRSADTASEKGLAAAQPKAERAAEAKSGQAKGSRPKDAKTRESNSDGKESGEAPEPQGSESLDLWHEINGTLGWYRQATRLVQESGDKRILRMDGIYDHFIDITDRAFGDAFSRGHDDRARAVRQEQVGLRSRLDQLADSIAPEEHRAQLKQRLSKLAKDKRTLIEQLAPPLERKYGYVTA